MTKEQIDEIKAIVNTLADQNGWAQLAAVGLEFRKQDLNYGDSLKTFFQEKLKDFFELKKCDAPDPKNPPVYQVKEKEGLDSSNKKQIYKQNYIKKFNPEEPELLEWAYLYGGWVETTKKLHDFIKKDENWYFGKSQNKDNPYPILSSYLKYTFVRLYKENKICYSMDKRYAAFNTGLVNASYESIYAIFDKNKNQQQEWHLMGFSPRETGMGKTIIGGLFDQIPPRAKYITEKDLMIPDGEKPTIDAEHIVERLERLPDKYLLKLCDGLSISDIEKCDTLVKRKKLLEPFKEKIRQDEYKLKQKEIKRDFNEALDMALKRVEWNYKTAIPVYWVEGNSISLLLPLAITNGIDIDLAFVISKQPNGKYVGQTIYTLDMAYSDARLIVRPDSDWLIPSEINQTQQDNIE